MYHIGLPSDRHFLHAGKDPTHFGNGERVTLDGVPGTDDHLRLHAIEMGAFVFDNPVVVLREQFVAAHGDNRVGRYFPALFDRAKASLAVFLSLEPRGNLARRPR